SSESGCGSGGWALGGSIATTRTQGVQRPLANPGQCLDENARKPFRPLSSSLGVLRVCRQALTFWPRPSWPLLLLKLPFAGLKIATTVCVPADSLAALLVALPRIRVTGAPKFLPSTWNWTVPVGVPLPWRLALATAAVKVTG